MSSIFGSPWRVWRQYFLPQHALSRLAGFLSHSQWPWLKNYLIHWFLTRYPVDLSIALESDPLAYPSYHAFFTRKLKPEHRPIAPEPEALCAPCDGTISQAGKMVQNTLVQAKGRFFSVSALLGEDKVGCFEGGDFFTWYLAPTDYHRVHMPLSGILEKIVYIPGSLFSVNPLTAQHVDSVFARNERVVCWFSHPQGIFAVVLVGAMLVGHMETRWGGFTSPRSSKKQCKIYSEQDPDRGIAKGEELGYFSLGSTVIVLLSSDFKAQYSFADGVSHQVGQWVGTITKIP